MLTDFIVSFVAVLAFALFEWSHNKATYNIKTAWFKYVCGLVFGTFGFSYLSQFKPFEYVMQACLVVAFLYFFWVIVNALKVKNVPGQSGSSAKMIAFLIVAATMFASCGKVTYDNTVHGHGVSLTSRTISLDSARILAPTGLYYIDSTHAGNPYISDSTILLYPTWSQAFAWQKVRGNRWIFVLTLILAAVFLGAFGYLTSTGGEKYYQLGMVGAAIICCIIAAASIEWEKWGMEQMIAKSLYNSIMNSGGDFSTFWNTIRIK